MSDALNLIFDEWKANLKQKDRSKNSVGDNFEELFNELKRANATFEEAHAILPRAIKAHLPSPGLAKNIYKSVKNNPKLTATSEKEFIESWNEDISSKATTAFFDHFPRPKNNLDDDGEPKVYGQMSAKEYKAQRKYADSFPRLNTELLERTLVSNPYNPADDIENILGKKNGQSD